MTAFLIIGALLVIGAVFFVVWPLLGTGGADPVSRRFANVALYRDQMKELETDIEAGTLSAQDHDQAKLELETRLLEDVAADATAPVASRRGRSGTIGVALAVPLCALAIYFVAGTPQALAPEDEVSAEQIEGMIQKLAARLQANPENIEGWTMLARSYAAMGRFDQAAAAYASAVKQAPNDAQLLADYADALAMAQGGRLQGEPEKLIAHALKIDPDNTKALALAGSLAFHNGNFAMAVEHWERVLRLIPPDSEFARSVAASVAEARTQGKLGGVAAAPSSVSPAPGGAAAVAVAVKGVVKLAPELAAKAAPTDTVFIFARAPGNSRLPLAMLRKQVRDLPVTFALDDSSAMAPGMNLSSQPEVVIVARISKTATATPRPGDLQGVSSTVANTASGIIIVIDSEVR